MKQLVRIFVSACMVLCAQMQINAVEFFARCKVEVAADSEGLGTVWIGAEGQTEALGSANNPLPSFLAQSASVAFKVGYTPAAGCSFSYFTDQEGQPVDITDGEVMVNATSKDENNPTLCTLYAHFVNKVVESVNIAVGAGKFATFAAPVNVSLPEGLVPYSVTSVQDFDDCSVLVLRQLPQGNLVPANTPVLIQNITISDLNVSCSFDKEAVTSAPVTEGLLTGVYEQTVCPQDGYLLAAGENGQVFRKMSGEEVAPYTCYLLPAGEEPNEIRLTDNNIRVSIPVPAQGYTTFNVPGDTELPAGVSAYNVIGVKKVNEELALVLEEVTGSVIAANTPVLLKNGTNAEIPVKCIFEKPSDKTPVSSNGLLRGVCYDTPLPAGDYMLGINPQNRYVFEKASEGEVGAYGCYLTVEGAGETIYVENDSLTAVNETYKDAERNPIYRLDGTRAPGRLMETNNLPAGIYVIGGKITIVR